MNQWYWLLLPLSFCVEASSLKTPHMFTLKPKSGDIMSSLLNGECTTISDNKIACTFNQILFSQRTSTQDDLNAELAKITTELETKENEVAELNRQVCSEEYRQGLSDIVASAKNENKKQLMTKWVELFDACPVTSTSEAKKLATKLVTLTHEIERTSCSVGVNTYTLTFDAIENGDNSFWRSTNEPIDNPCGMANVVTMTPSKYGMWEYRGMRVLAFPENQTGLGQSCLSMDVEPMVWSWDGEDIYKNCQIIGIGF
ncbi:TPA: hypothetical protein ACMDT1_003445 [Vibrio parahaemolyticus]|uniref:hypothetical protein n=1 Tax=Vibrio parahaemolyticus TaxID=670 RepID=UPI00084A94A9|nr:hypothetical protein [Vibrio parahaemolyticus]ELA9071206.1 hypothetical protein [Vibrio parahaemolyticus]ODW24179.1 hypothetical protein BBM88_16955 [Vibrio parahaemolyticus]ODY66385.1 hypothetical protein BBM28_20005 [Vibrio parahaemolyticus]ODY75980.1 hypothetical protein BBM27_00470 [Vibrio parahaemolyticus]